MTVWDEASARMAGTPCGGMKVILAVPTYGPSDQGCQKSVRIAMMVAANNGVVWVGDSSPDRMGFSWGRNAVVNEVRNYVPEADAIMWIDSDIRVPVDGISKIVSECRRQDISFMTGVYHQRGIPYDPVFYHFDRDKQKFRVSREYPLDVVAPTEACGFGFVFTRMDVFTAIERHPDFNPEAGWFPDTRDAGGRSEDLNFCYQAMMAKVQLYVHTGIMLGHVGEPEVVTRETFLRFRENLDEGNGRKPGL